MMAGDKDQQEQPVKINKWDGAACKNAIDDAIKDVLTTKYKYSECFRIIDGRLLICSVAVAIALFGLLWDHLYPFPLSKPILIACVSSYFVLMGVLTLYTTYKEKGIFVVAIQKDSKSGQGMVWEASSCMTKFDDRYFLTLSCKDTTTGKVREASVIKSVANFIDDSGIIVMEAVEPEVVRLHNSLQSDRKDK